MSTIRHSLRLKIGTSVLGKDVNESRRTTGKRIGKKALVLGGMSSNVWKFPLATNHRSWNFSKDLCPWGGRRGSLTRRSVNSAARFYYTACKDLSRGISRKIDASSKTIFCSKNGRRGYSSCDDKQRQNECSKLSNPCPPLPQEVVVECTRPPCPNINDYCPSEEGNFNFLNGQYSLMENLNNRFR